MLCPASHSEFALLPPKVKQKYFSTLERLRYAHGQSADALAMQAREHGRSITKMRPSTSTGARSRSLGRPAKRSHTIADVSREDALWFSQLPDKVKRNHFSVEEQNLLAGNQEPVILDATHDLLYKLGGRDPNRSLPSLQSCRSDQTESDEDEDRMDGKTADTFAWLNHEDLDLSLDDYHVQIASQIDGRSRKLPNRPRYGGRQASLPALPLLGRASDMARGRSLEIGNDRLPREPFDPVLPSKASSPSGAVQPRTASQSTPARQPLALEHRYQQTPPVIDPTAAHVSDPTARLKLRLYLGSAAKFDEALEFGFPSLEKPSVRAPPLRRPSNVSRRRHPTAFWSEGEHPGHGGDARMEYYGAENGSSLFDREPDYSANRPSLSSSTAFSDSELVSPSTPAFDSNLFRPVRLPISTDGYAAEFAGGREMTLRMTLTRKDLRADESLLYSDPIAGDVWRAEDLYAVEDRGRIRRLYNRIRGL